jgi:hypothetical protein
MGRTVPSITQAFLRLEAFRFARLRRSDQLVLDDLFASARQHLAAAAYASHALPFETLLLAMLLEEHKEVMRLRAASTSRKRHERYPCRRTRRRASARITGRC